MLAFTDALGLKSSALYAFDYGAPTGFRLDIGAPGRRHGHRFTEWQCLRRRPGRRSGAQQTVLDASPL